VPSVLRLRGHFLAIPVANANRFFDGVDEDLPVTYLLRDVAEDSKNGNALHAYHAGSPNSGPSSANISVYTFRTRFLCTQRRVKSCHQSRTISPILKERAR